MCVVCVVYVCVVCVVYVCVVCVVYVYVVCVVYVYVVCVVYVYFRHIQTGLHYQPGSTVITTYYENLFGTVKPHLIATV